MRRPLILFATWLTVLVLLTHAKGLLAYIGALAVITAVACIV